jgi:signal transduction histidine kinase
VAPGSPASSRDLVFLLVTLRRILTAIGMATLLLERLVGPPEALVAPAECILVTVFAVNELARWLLGRADATAIRQIVNLQVGVDVVMMTALLHLGGGIASPGILLFAPPFFAYGAVLPLKQVFAHVGGGVGALAALAVVEYTGILPHYDWGFYAPGIHTRVDFLVLTIVLVSMANALCASMSHFLGRLLRLNEEQASKLAAERGALLARNEREAAHVRVLLDVAHHVSGTHSVDEFLGAVCDTTVALARVPRVEVFLWDPQGACLRLSAARGLAAERVRSGEVHYPADMPIVARLRAGEVVDFGAVPSHSLVEGRVETSFRRGFAAPLVYRESFEGALFVGYDDENTEEFVELVQGIARQAALALVNVRTMEQQQEDAEVSNVLLQISQALSACLDEEALWRLLIRAGSEVIDLPWSVACRFDEGAGTFRVAGAHGLPDEVLRHFAEVRYRPDDSPLLQEVLSRREVIAADESVVRDVVATHGWHVGPWLVIPLFRGSWISGLLAVGHFRRRPLSRRQMRLAEGLGHHASIALQNARLVANLEAADRLKSEFVSTMSHELRTPLNVIIGYTEMLRDGAVGPVTPKQLDLINRLDARGRELLELIEATLHVGRLEAGRDIVEIAPIAFGELLQALKASTSGLPHAPSVAFEWEVPGESGTRIMTDRTKLSLVVRNLVSNAFKFTAEGKVVVRIMFQADAMVVEVRDTGIGIDAKHLPIIFDMFRQVDGSMTRRHGGVGLGLYIVKQFVRRLGATVDVTSTPGQGSTFRVVMPGVVRSETRQAFRAA